MSNDHNPTCAIIQFRSSRSKPARQQVFNTPELLDYILSELELKDLLLKASLTCLGFQKVIESSPTINQGLRYSIINAARDHKVPCRSQAHHTAWFSKSIEINYLNSKSPDPSLHIWFDRVSLAQFMASRSFRKVLMPEKNAQHSVYWMESEPWGAVIVMPSFALKGSMETIGDDLQYISDLLYYPEALRSMCWFIKES